MTRVLLVENHAVFAATVTQQFLAGHAVRVVPTLHAARAALASEPWDVIVVDYDLDDGKGDVLVRELRTSGGRVRIIAFSAHEGGNAALLRAGADCACPKQRANALPGLISPPLPPAP